jgi:hypothetical protein
MNCPKCGMARALTDQVCRRCKYVFDEDRFLDLKPPQVDEGVPARPYQARSRIDWGITDFLSQPWIPPLASVIPGFGHYLQRRRVAALVYFGAVAVLLLLSVMNFSKTTGQMLFGLMVSTHATCILDTTPWGKAPEAWKRLTGMAGLLSILMFLYWPLVTLLANTFVAQQRYRREGILSWNPLQQSTQLIIMAITFALSAAASVWLSKRLTELES